MRVLVVAAPLTGHLLPLVPLAVALRDLGHEVTLASGHQQDAVAGFPVHDISADIRLFPLGLRLAARRPGLARREMRGEGGVEAVAPMFGAINAHILDDVVALADAVRPDVVVHEPLAVSGAVAAAVLGVPAVLVENMMWEGPVLVEATGRDARLLAAAARRGVHAVPAPSAVVTTGPPSVVGRRAGLPMRAIGPVDASTAAEPEWLFAPAERPRLLVTHSTIVGPGSIAHARKVVDVAAELDAEVVLVRAPEKIAAGSLPANVRTVGWVPLDRAMGSATAIVHHGGAGTALGALAAGIPQLVVPSSGDRRYNARLVAARGAGLAVATPDITPEVLTTLLTAAPLRTAAEGVAAEMAAMPAPSAVAGELVGALARR